MLGFVPCDTDIEWSVWTKVVGKNLVLGIGSPMTRDGLPDEGQACTSRFDEAVFSSHKLFMALNVFLQWRTTALKRLSGALSHLTTCDVKKDWNSEKLPRR